MQKTKKIIIILILILVVIAVTIIGIYMNIVNKDEQELMTSDVNDTQDETNFDNQEEIMNKEITILQTENEFFTIEKQIQNYILYNTLKNNEAVYDVLDSDYINKNNITKENASEIIDKLSSVRDCEISLQKVYARDSIDKPIYYAQGILKGKQGKTQIYMDVKWDTENNIYCLSHLSENEYNKYIKEEEKEENNFTIEKNEYNTMERVMLSDEDKAEKYLNSYIYNAIHNTQVAYDNINEGYRQKKFSNFQEYVEYLNNKKEQLIALDKSRIETTDNLTAEEEYQLYTNKNNAGLSKYSFDTSLDAKKCICVDTYGNYYIFNITGAMQYNVILDVFTIDVPEFIEKYNSASDDKKASMNISKIVDAINDKDYKYVYNKLNETYKNSNFTDINKFKEFLNNKFYDESVIKESTAKKDGDVYICNLKISDKEGTSKLVDVTILVRLSQGTNYEISFSM